MYNISSKLTKFLSGVFPIILITLIALLALFYLFHRKVFIIAIIFQLLLFLLLWRIFFKNLQTVYIENKTLKFNHVTLPFKNILNVTKLLLAPIYIIKFKIGDEIKTVSFMPNIYLPFFTPSYIKEIKKHINQPKNEGSKRDTM